MKREQFITDLIKEGLTEKTLVKFSDKQIKSLHERFFGEQVQATTKSGIEMPHVKSGGPDERTLKQQGKTFVAYEGEMGEGKKLTDKQKKFLDKNKNNKLDAEDFKMLRKGKKEDTNETKDDKKWIQKAIDPKKEGSLKKSLGVKKDEKIPSKKLKSAAKKGGKLGQRARLAMTLKGLKENEILDLFESMVKEKYHPFTSKYDILKMVNQKLNEDNNQLPDFFTWDAIKNIESDNVVTEKKGAAEPAVKPPKTKPDEKEKKRPGYVPTRKDKPGEEKKPKA